MPDEQDVGDEANTLKMLGYAVCVQVPLCLRIFFLFSGHECMQAREAREQSDDLADEDDFTSPLDAVDECGLFLATLNGNERSSKNSVACSR